MNEPYCAIYIGSKGNQLVRSFLTEVEAISWLTNYKYEGEIYKIKLVATLTRELKITRADK